MALSSAAGSSHAHVLDQRHQRHEGVGVGGDAAERGPVGVHAVVGVRAGDADLLARLADRTPVGAGELGGGVHRVRAAARGEEHLGARHRGQRRDPAGQVQRWLVGVVLEHLVGGELAHLRGRGVGQLGAAMPDVAVPEAGQGVQVRAALGVDDVRALTADDRDGMAGQAGHVGERIPERVRARVISLYRPHRPSSSQSRQTWTTYRARAGAPAWGRGSGQASVARPAAASPCGRAGCGQPMDLAPSSDSRMMSA